MSRWSTEEILRAALFADPEGRHEGGNLVDALFAIAESLKGVSSALRDLGNGNACTQMGAVEAHSVAMKEAIEHAGALVAEAVREQHE